MYKQAKGFSLRMVNNATPRSSDHFSSGGIVGEDDLSMFPQQPRQRRKAGTGSSSSCGCCKAGYDSSEYLEYNYSYVGTTQPLPRCRERGEYYIDSFNDQPWSWTFGTGELVSFRMRFCCSPWVLALMMLIYLILSLERYLVQFI